MVSNDSGVERFRRRWWRTTTLGWLLGLGALLVLTIVGDLLFAGQAQFMVGLGIGAGVGYMQSRALSERLPAPARWTLASALGMSALFLVHDLAGAAGVDVPYSLPAYVLCGGLFTGLWQWLLLRPVSTRAAWWIPTSVAAWALPAIGVALADWEPAGFAGDLSGLISIFLGGALLGLASAGPMAWLLGDSDADGRT